MDRRSAILAPLETTGRGIEIAPYFNPFLSKSEFNVAYTDYVSTEELRAKAAENPTATDRPIPTIDFVWKPGSPLRQCGETFDYALASHVVEHVPNTVGWLNEIMSVLKVGGTLALIVPNKTSGGDFYRRETTVAELVGAAVERRSIPTPSQVFDFMSRSIVDTGVRPAAFGDDIDFAAVLRPYTDASAIETAIATNRDHNYVDIHCTVWTERSFIEAFREIHDLGLMNIAVSDAVATAPWEFVVHLTKFGEPRIPIDPPSGIDADLEYAQNALGECVAKLRAYEERDRRSLVRKAMRAIHRRLPARRPPPSSPVP